MDQPQHLNLQQLRPQLSLPPQSLKTLDNTYHQQFEVDQAAEFRERVGDLGRQESACKAGQGPERRPEECHQSDATRKRDSTLRTQTSMECSS